MDGRYEVFATHGKGVFSSVLRARDKQNPVPGTEVAIKMIRSNETMYKAAQTEKVCFHTCWKSKANKYTLLFRRFKKSSVGLRKIPHATATSIALPALCQCCHSGLNILFFTWLVQTLAPVALVRATACMHSNALSKAA